MNRASLRRPLGCHVNEVGTSCSRKAHSTHQTRWGVVGILPVHEEEEVKRQFMVQRADLDLNVTGQGLKVDSYRKGRARPDGILAPVDHFAGQGEWADPAGVLVVVEVTSWDSDTNAHDRAERAHAYAACGIGVYLLVDRDDDSVTVHSEPEGGRYRSIATLGYGHTVEIPGVGVTLNTDGLKRYGR